MDECPEPAELLDPPVDILVNEPAQGRAIVAQPEQRSIEFCNPAVATDIGRFEPVPETGANRRDGNQQIDHQIDKDTKRQLLQMISEANH